MSNTFRNLTGPVAALAVLGLISNLLMLTGSLFMLQVYDRVLVSRSVPTLQGLVLIVIFLYALYALVEALRARIALRIANVIDIRLRPRLFRTGVRMRLVISEGNRADPVRDGDVLRQFVSSAGIFSFMDLPWVPIYVAIVFFVHPTLGWLAIAGVVAVAGLLVANEMLSRRPDKRTLRTNAARQTQIDNAMTNAESVMAMGMLPSLAQKWDESTSDLRASQDVSADRSSTITSISKALRFLLQSSVLAVGAYLVIQGEMSAGVMIAASVITSRALAPIEQVVAHWRGFVSARQAMARIKQALTLPDLVPRPTRVNLPSHVLELSGSIVPPGSRKLVLTGIQFALSAGDVLGVLGPSGSGKTALARALVGTWATVGGDVRLDGVSLQHYDVSDLGRIIGYLPQEVELFSGTIADNIARFEPNANAADVIAAARFAGVHELVSSFANGYDTEIGDSGGLLSAGQRQRIGLARAIYRQPFVVVLDEPNSNLDHAGDLALTAAIESLSAAGAIVVVIAHRPSAIAAATHLLVIRDGRQSSFGVKDDVLGVAPAAQVGVLA